ncbi:hypothetical protein HWV23_02680 [Natronomonas halophila]|uniref:hypothetical protein n=1 Tax=Natronomonas halophila TaxID=2747817 RepID=UPI0015B44E6B|nr:hypothetical protein [Natronomonas halophila]QLD84605.1 hypothetical protein HWV23_02395 [Natronomonas halophila]QLD84661.1 hypothetical protein HWV23_02680 [Natronomonas halophila]
MMLEVALSSGLVETVQGPPWLANVLYDPPRWLYVACTVATLAMGLLLSGLAVHVGMDKEIVVEMATNASIVACIGVATRLSTVFLTQPYVVDVGLGFIVGAAVSLGLVKPALRSAFGLDANAETEQGTDSAGTA